MIEQAGCKLLFLPLYSPDLNKIQKFWACLKNQRKQNRTSGKKTFGMRLILLSNFCPNYPFTCYITKKPHVINVFTDKMRFVGAFDQKHYWTL
ncbi:transposase [Nostoc sp.]|uniref:transposase n=1 Tax=Nostoc sp. TaxID=1180 RepID=UPI003FA5E003